MHKMGLKSIVSPKKAGTIENNKERVPATPNILNRQFNTTQPNKVFVTDITYLRSGNKMYYYSVVLDLFDRNPLVCYISDKIDRSITLHTIKLLAKKVDLKGCLVHSDQGIQYTNKDYVVLADKLGFTRSQSRKGTPYDNAVMEHFFGVIKKESIYLYPKRTNTYEGLKELLTEEIDYYTNYRPQKHLGGMPPNIYRNNYFSLKTQN